MTVSPRDADVIQEAFGQRVRDALDALETATHFGDEPGPTYRAGVAALDALLARVHALERAAGQAHAFAEMVLDFIESEAPAEWDGGDVGYSLGGIAHTAKELQDAIARAVVLEGAAE